MLQELADMNIISIEDQSMNGFKAIVKKLRAKETLSLEEITLEVELARAKRYGNKA